MPEDIRLEVYSSSSFCILPYRLRSSCSQLRMRLGDKRGMAVSSNKREMSSFLVLCSIMLSLISSTCSRTAFLIYCQGGTAVFKSLCPSFVSCIRSASSFFLSNLHCCSRSYTGPGYFLLEFFLDLRPLDFFFAK